MQPRLVIVLDACRSHILMRYQGGPALRDGLPDRREEEDVCYVNLRQHRK
jgi:hypothetical protein